MRYGYFDDSNREYVITRPDTPLPWINYLGVDSYCGLMSNTAGGYSFYKDAAHNRLLRYRYNNVPSDRPGRYIYMRDNKTKDYWSATWQPTNKDLKKYKYECRHGLSYTKISSEYAGIKSETTYFVPVGEANEIWRIKVKNNTNKARSISLFTYVEFCLWDALNDMTDYQYNLNIGKTEFKNNCMYHLTLYNMHKHNFAYFWSNTKVASFDGVRQNFVGPYRGEANPIAVENGKCSGSLAVGWAPFGGLNVNLTLKAKEEKEVVFVLGYGEGLGAEKKAMTKYKNPKNVDKALAELKSHWDENLAKYTAETPDPAVNSMVNIWNQYQCKTTFDWSRYISFYENGEGRGMGTRDSCQDTLAINSQMPERARQRIFRIISTCQFETGDTYHQFFPAGGKGDLKGFSDDHLWLIQMVHAYISETGDMDVLKEECGYADSVKKAPIYQHLVDAVNYTERMKGAHGLPLILTADWNDTLHLWMEAEKPESVVTAGLYVYALRLLSQLSKKMSKPADEKLFNERADKMTSVINDKCWDGYWYVRGFGSEVIGTQKSEKAKIFLNSQVWSVISGAAPYERSLMSMNSVREHLASPEGVKKLWPSFDKYDQTYGLISRYNTGRKENGIFAHANAWAIVAECVMNRPDIAFEYYKNILPLKGNDSAEILKTEPYVFCQAIVSNEGLNVGEGANSWLTGTASWMYVAATQYILGIKPTLDGLSIMPRVPSAWTDFTVKRTYRGCEYEIRVKRGVKGIEVDGKPIIGTVVPVSTQKTCLVEVNI